MGHNHYQLLQMKTKDVNDTIENGGCSSENKNRKEKKEKILYHSEYDDPGIYDEFYPLWGPGSKYKPWIA